jgi:mannose-6-phosphate isomerase-like protein (cupin superfamily)
MSLTDSIATIKQKQRTIDDLLSAGDIKSVGVNGTSRWVLDPLYQDGDCSIGFVYCSDVSVGDFPEHIHEDSKEYLIVVKGRIILNIDGENCREIGEGGCASIPAGAVHHSKPLEPDTKLAYICVPCDKNLGGKLNIFNK